MKVVLVRHTSVGIDKGLNYGWSDVTVASTFPQEAQRTKETLESLTGGKTFDAVFASPLKRARLLADYCGFSNPLLDDRLKEFNMGDWELKRYDDLWKDDLYYREWMKDYLHLPTPHGETFPQFYHRVTSFLDELKTRPYKRAVIFAHGGVLLCAGIYAGLFDVEHAYGADGHLVDFGGIEAVSL